ncbi:MAG: serine/threonine protein kinase [Deltaproteobacteria bacterium]|nr:MAG: serine/threonine protein kinase [Deltaproteobacteria bacterium]
MPRSNDLLDPIDLAEGERIAGRFRILRKVGQGGLAAVYAAEDEVLHIDVALKVLLPHLTRRKVIVERFRREVAISRRIAHDNVVRIFDLVEEEARGLICLVMEFLPGGDLEERIVMQGRLPLSEVIAIGKGALGGLAAAHREGIIHRDVKPHNLLFDEGGNVKIGDFGLARSGDFLGFTMQGHVMGTPEYLAPEMAGAGPVDARADLYALGVTLYEAAAGVLPFQGNDPLETMRMHLEVPPPPLRSIAPELPEGFERVLAKALEKDPGRRFQTAEAFIEALDTLSVPSVPEIVSRHPCPHCGAGVLDDFSYCFTCGHLPLLLRPQPKGEGSYRLVVVGPGKVAERIGHDMRRKILALFRGLDLDTNRLSKRLPRLPFVLIDRLSRPDARLVQRHLEEVGIESRIEARKHTPPIDPKETLVRKDLRLKTKTMFGRYLAVLGGTFGGMWYFLVGNPTMIAAFSAVLLALPLGLFFRYRQPELRWRRRGGEAFALGPALLPIAKRLQNENLRRLMERIVGKGFAIRRQLQRSKALSPPLRQEADRALVALLKTASRLLEEAATVEAKIRKLDEAACYRELARIERKLEATTVPEEIAHLLEVRGTWMETLDTFHRLERLESRLTDRLCAISARLDAFALHLAARSGQIGREQLLALLEPLAALHFEIEGEREVEDALA